MKAGWPWTEGSKPLRDAGQEGSLWPGIAVVTPSYNQGQFIEDTIRSVLLQGYPNLEYVIIDGESNDGSVEVIRKYEKRLSHWVSEKDEGQYHALNKGFAHVTGEIMAWLNADDMYTPWAFHVVGDIFRQFPQIEWLTTRYPLRWNERGWAVHCKKSEGYNARAFYAGMNLPDRNASGKSWIQQESTFWRRSLWEKTGGKMEDSLNMAGDFELWARFFEHADLFGVSATIAGFRVHPHQKTTSDLDAYYHEAKTVLKRYNNPRASVLERHLVRRILRRLPMRIARLIPGATYEKKGVNYHHGQKRWVIGTGRFI